MLRSPSRLLLLVAIALGSVASFWLGCSSTTCEETLDCPKAIGGESGSSGEGGLPDGPPEQIDGCVTKNAPKDDGCVLQDAVGVFVSPTGDDGAPGTTDKPVASVNRAVAIARLAGKTSIFVCGGAYTSNIEIPPGPAVAVFGGLKCDGKWTYSGTVASFAPAVPPANGAALLVDQVAPTTTLADLEVVAPAVTTPGASSVAAFVRSCSGVKLERVTLRAKDGAPGAPGANGAFADSARSTGSSNGAGAVTCQCTAGGATSGAGGGAGGVGATGGGAGTPNLGATPPDNGAGGAAGCTAGADGAPGANGAAGTAVAVVVGTLTAQGWQPTAAARAANGGTAQGGGGGGGSLLGGGGGGGGCGGCGGQGGMSGGQGGSSFGLLSFQSNVALDACTITTGAGGAGGKGGNGQTGQGGANGGGGACAGGKGGAGGGGGGGAGGAGGHAIGVGFQGQAPSGMPMVTNGGAGAGGAGGTASTPQGAGQAGKAGVAAPSQPFP